MAVQHDVGAAIKRGVDAFLDLVSIGVNWAVDQYVALFDLSPLAFIIGLLLVIFLLGWVLWWWFSEFLWGILALAIVTFVVGGVGWLIRIIAINLFA